MTRAIVFPGQGSQAVGMGCELADACPAAREVFDVVDEALGQKLGISKERVRQIQNKALEKIRQSLKEEFLT